MSRADFGYVERSRAAIGKVTKVGKSKRDEEEDGFVETVRSEKDARGLVRSFAWVNG